jgi:threonyl-tRNA synthetase
LTWSPGTWNADWDYYVVTADAVVPIGDYPAAARGAGLAGLIEQEVRGRRLERTPPRLAELLETFGFAWEPLSEPGHMRVLDHAAFMLDRAKTYAARQAAAIFRALDVPCVNLDGVSLVDPYAPVMREYLRLTTRERLYGDAPYQVGGGDRTYMLRQTACLQKYSACLDRRPAAGALPVALFEISDSFRREPAETLRLGYRLRRFHLPEAHIHGRGVRDSAELTGHLHGRILRVLAELEADLVLLISATHEFAAAYPGYLNRLAAAAGAPALLKVAPPGGICGDGVEVDVEYKLVDALGCCRELSTFQIDDLITRAFGVRCADGSTPSTIHAVPTGGVERHLFAQLDRIVRGEAAGLRRHLPLWLSPVVARVVSAGPESTGAAAALARRLAAAGIRTELDDREHDLDSAIRDADALLVPYLLCADAAAGSAAAEGGGVRVRDYRSGVFRDRDLAAVIAEVRGRDDPPAPDGFPRLSRRPFDVVPARPALQEV